MLGYNHADICSDIMSWVTCTEVTSNLIATKIRKFSIKLFRVKKLPFESFPKINLTSK